MRLSLLTAALLFVIAGPALALSEDDLLQDPAGAFLLASKKKDEKDFSQVIHFARELPKDVPPLGTSAGKPLGLFVCFHGHGGKAPNEAETVIRTLKRLGKLGDFVVLGAKSKDAGWTDADLEPVTRLINWALKEHAIDPRRVYTFGMSSGGYFSGNYGLSHPELIAASVVFGSGVPAHKVKEVRDPLLTMPGFYTVMGLDDDEPHKESSRRGSGKLKQHGYRYVYREVDGLGHSSNHPPTNDDSLLWAMTQRHKLIAPPESELASLRAVARPSPGRPNGAEAFIELVRIGGLPAGAALVTALGAGDPPQRQLAVQAAGKGQHGDEAVAALVRRLKDADAGVRLAAIPALGVAAAWRAPAAQEALCLLAVQKGAAPERSAVLDALAHTVRFQIKGDYQDPPLFKALSAVLDDEDVALRTRAAEILKPAANHPYDPAAEPAARKAAAAKWQEWAVSLIPTEDKYLTTGGRPKR